VNLGTTKGEESEREPSRRNRKGGEKKRLYFKKRKEGKSVRHSEREQDGSLYQRKNPGRWCDTSPIITEKSRPLTRS